jgi:hypothetical protein
MWVANYQPPAPVHFHATDRSWARQFSRRRDGELEVELDFSKPLANSSLSNDHSQIQIWLGGRELRVLVGTAAGGIADPAVFPGFVQISARAAEIPGDKERALLVDALSFALGRQLVPVGETWFGEQWWPVRSIAVSGHYLGRTSGFAEHSFAPADLSLGGAFLDENKLSKLVNSFLTTARKTDLDFPLWLVWLAQASPLDAQPAHLGAALEALRKTYCDGGTKLQTRLLPKADWTPLRDALLPVLDKFAGSKNSTPPYSILRNKICQLNNKSSNMQYDEFFEVLGLEVGDVESQALRERNRPAHGHRYKQSDYESLAGSAWALHALFWRTMLRIVGWEGSYIDYSTLGFPSRALSEPLGGPNGDGQPAST